MRIIEDSPSTKGFKYRLLSELIKKVGSWDGKYFNHTFCHVFFVKEELPLKLEKSEKDKNLIEETIRNYVQDYLDDFLVGDVNYWTLGSPPLDVEIRLKKSFNKRSIERELSLKAQNLLDELVEEPYDEVSERKAVLAKLGEQYESGTKWDERSLTSSSFNNEERKHVRIFKILREFGEEGLISVVIDFSSMTETPTLDVCWTAKYIAQEKFFGEYEKLKREIAKNGEDVSKSKLKQKNFPTSIYLVTSSIAANGAIFLILDGRFEMPIRFKAKNSRGEETGIKKLHNIAYPVVNAPEKSVAYSKKLADSINNGLFRKLQAARYMRTNKLDKPTLVQRSETGTLVLRNDVPVTTILIRDVPSQYEFLYTEKLR